MFVLVCALWLAVSDMFTFVAWNCQHGDVERYQDLSEEFRFTDIVAVTSTGERAAADRLPVCTDLRVHFVLRCCFVPGVHVSRACGTALLLRKRVFKPKDVYDVPSVPISLQGRVAVFRLRSGRFDI
eukprot:9471101-Pyramimonas_sp.AAC.1